MAVFDSKIFNPAVFEKYAQRVPNLNRNELIKSGAVQKVNKYKSRMVDQVGGNYVIEPIMGVLNGDVLNYDGETDLTTTSRKTFMQGKVAIGRMKGWEEKDFSQELTGVDWIKTVATEVEEYYQHVDQNDLLAILAGIFAMTDTGTGSAEFKAKHITDLTQVGEGTFGATTLNTAMQRAGGDNKAIYKLAFMHSAVATNLENLQLLGYLKYTDKDGITRDLGIATLNGRLVIIDDEMPVEEVEAEYEKTSDEAVVDGKTYYTRSGSAGNYTYTEVTSPSTASIGSYYEMTAAAYEAYTTYVLGQGAFEYEDLGARKPNTMARDEVTDGGVEKLYTRRRKILVPKWISFTKASMAKASPTIAELANGANWEVANTGESTVANREYVNPKGIPMLKIVTKG